MLRKGHLTAGWKNLIAWHPHPRFRRGDEVRAARAPPTRPPSLRRPEQQSWVQAPDSPPCPFLFRREKLSLGKSHPISPESADDIYTQKTINPSLIQNLAFSSWWVKAIWKPQETVTEHMGGEGGETPRQGPWAPTAHGACNCLTQILCFFTNQ